MALYNKLSTTKAEPLTMVPFVPVDRYTVADPFNLPTAEMNNNATRWPAGSLVLVGGETSKSLWIFRETVNNLGADGKGQIASVILATIDSNTVDKVGTGWLKTMFNGAETCVVELYKV